MHKSSCLPSILSSSCEWVSGQLCRCFAAGQAQPNTPRKFRITYCHNNNQVLQEWNPGDPPHNFFCALMIFTRLPSKAFRCLSTSRRSMEIPASGCLRSCFLSYLSDLPRYYSQNLAFSKDSSTCYFLCLSSPLSTGKTSIDRVVFWGKSK